MSPRWDHPAIEPKLRKAIEIQARRLKSASEKEDEEREKLYELLDMAVEDGASQTELSKITGIHRPNLRRLLENRGTLKARTNYRKGGKK